MLLNVRFLWVYLYLIINVSNINIDDTNFYLFIYYEIRTTRYTNKNTM